MGTPDSVVSVADFARRLRRAVGGVSAGEWIEGEVVSAKRAGSGHVYFSLKDAREEAALDCVMYRADALRARQELFDGAKVHGFARASLWLPRGRLQLTVSSLRPAGLGSLLERLEKLKQKLAAEGLFDRSRKRLLPPAPRVIGVVTSAHGAALHDVRTVAFRRGRVRLRLVDAQVQGEAAPRSLVAALSLLARDPAVEVVIVGRGGGASEDLMAFNDERVVRAVAASPVPIVSAVGHEIDITLTDLVADVRAATPSQAAELVVADDAASGLALGTLRARLARAARQRLAEDAAALRRLGASLGDPRFTLAQHQQELDALVLRAERCQRRSLAARKGHLQGLRARLLARHPRLRVARCGAALQPLLARLRAAAQLRHRSAESVLAQARGRLEALSPLQVLGRGYAIATTEDGTVLTAQSQVATGEQVSVRLHRGRLLTEVIGLQKHPTPRQT